MFRYLSPALVSSLLWALLVVCSPLAGAAANLAAGDGHTLALASDGTVWVWGDNCRGQLGDGTTTNRATPVQVLGAEGNGFLNLLQVSTPSSGDIVMTLEEPVAGSTYSGVTNVRGWAVASAGMDKVELYVDDQFFSPIPLGGRRADVGAAYPDYPGSAQSGFAMAFNYSELAAGPHTFTVRATDVSGGARDARVTANVVRFENSYMADPAAVNLDQATLGGSGNALTIQNLLVDGQPYTVRLDWRPAAQSFAFTQIARADRPNQSPAGGLWRGEAVCFYMAANGSSLTREGSTCPPGAASDPSPAFYGGPWPIGDGLSVEVFYYEDVPVVDNAFSFVEAYAGSVTGTFTSPQAASGTAVAGSITWSAIPASRSAAVLGSRPISGVARRDSANGTAASVIRDAAGRIVVRLTYSP